MYPLAQQTLLELSVAFALLLIQMRTQMQSTGFMSLLLAD